MKRLNRATKEAQGTNSTPHLCIFTGEPTNMLTKGKYPVSRAGREVLRERQQIMAEVKMEEHNKFLAEVNEVMSKSAAEKGEIHVEIPLSTDVSKYLPSVREVILEQVKQNKGE